MNLFLIDRIGINNESIILRVVRYFDRNRYNVLINRLNYQNNNDLHNINSFSFYNPNDNNFYNIQLIENNIIDNMNNRIVRRYVWSELEYTNNLNFNYRMYSIPHEVFIYIVGLIATSNVL